MKSTAILLGLILFTSTTLVSGDDTQALQNTLSSLCQLNKEGKFASCCSSYSNGTSVTLEPSDARDCFISSLWSPSGSTLIALLIEQRDLTVLESGVFDGLNSLNWLSLNSNSLNSLPSDVFHGLNNLYTLDLHSNRLNSLPSDVFHGLNNLGNLHLHYNSLNSLPSDVFHGLNNLGNLHLHYNRLNSLPSGVFDGLGNLAYLDLKHNSLTSLHSNVFDGLDSLSTLALDFNRLDSLNDTLFANLTNLVDLEINGNALTSLPSDLFKNNINLWSLSFDNNKLTTIPDGLFSQLTSLSSLRLGSNSLTFVDMGAITPSYLDLQFNYLVSFRQSDEVVKSTTTEMSIYLDFNCLVQSQIPSYVSPFVEVTFYSNQDNCLKGTCKRNTLREHGCFMCSGDGADNNCETCVDGYVRYAGECVKCLSTEQCPFNNTNEIFCIDNNDLSHCNVAGATNCSDGVCSACGNGIVEGREECDQSLGCDNNTCYCLPEHPLNSNTHTCTYCGNGVLEGTEECEIGGAGCQGCVCMKGWYSKHSTDCESHCGDGNLTSDKECDSSLGCDNNTCYCLPEYPFDSNTHTCAYCGNGIVEGTEECDGTEHCGTECKCEQGYAVSESTPGVCVSKKTSSASQTPLLAMTLILAVVIVLFI